MSATSSLRKTVKSLDAQVSRALPLEHRRRWFFLKAQHRWPSFREPKTFSEKINWRMLYDRRDLIAWTCDKLKMKEHAVASGADVVVPRTLWWGDDVRDLRSIDLPDRWVLKPTHRYGLVHFGDPATDWDALAVKTAGWLDEVQSDFLGEWAYSQAEPHFLVEEFIGAPGSPPPDDYKFMVFDGEPRVVQVDLNRFGGHRRSMFTPEWESIPVQYRVPDAGPQPRPALLPEMLQAARVLGQGFDFIRVDLYVDGDAVVFGEYTPYPAGGLGRIRPRRFDAALGDMWRLPDLGAPSS